MCGLSSSRSSWDWTISEAANAYMFRTDIQYALESSNLRTKACPSGPWNAYKKLVVDDDLAAGINERHHDGLGRKNSI